MRQSPSIQGGLGLKKMRERRLNFRFQRRVPAQTSPEAGRGVTHAAVACTRICGTGLWAEHTRRLTCQAPAACAKRRERSWRWLRSGSPILDCRTVRRTFEVNPGAKAFFISSTLVWLREKPKMCERRLNFRSQRRVPADRPRKVQNLDRV
jgi:hypothetical protein